MKRMNILRIGTFMVAFVTGWSFGKQSYIIAGTLLVSMIFLIMGTHMKEE